MVCRPTLVQSLSRTLAQVPNLGFFGLLLFASLSLAPQKMDSRKLDFRFYQKQGSDSNWKRSCLNNSTVQMHAETARGRPHLIFKSADLGVLLSVSVCTVATWRGN